MFLNNNRSINFTCTLKLIICTSIILKQPTMLLTLSSKGMELYTCIVTSHTSASAHSNSGARQRDRIIIVHSLKKHIYLTLLLHSSLSRAINRKECLGISHVIIARMIDDDNLLCYCFYTTRKTRKLHS